MALRGRLSRRSGGAILHFSHPPIPDVIRFRDNDFRAKREFHVTLIGSTTMRTLMKESDLDVEDVLRRAGRKLAFSVALRDELWHLRENETRTLIRLCDVSGADEFFTRIEDELQIATERPPYHVTLYTIGTLRGIGIATHADLEQFGEKIEGAERDALLSVLQ